MLKQIFAIFCFLCPLVVLADGSEKTYRVAIYNGPGAAEICCDSSYDILDKEPDITPKTISPEEIRQGELRHFDVVIFPGGTGSDQSQAIGEEGWKELRRFLNEGGGYFGTCAGAYLALTKNRADGSLIDAKLKSDEWERGKAILKIELSQEGTKILGDHPGLLDIHYENGPILTEAHNPNLTPYITLAYFRSEVADNDTPTGIQTDSPAIVAGKYGKGRVIISSPHPELTPALNDFLPPLVRYAAGD
ncbi:MAG: BPL-N domain-containing protein [Planctomycetia bacterium]|nr:BPL-N domain-containing protein [Planctomycetia bacterium]